MPIFPRLLTPSNMAKLGLHTINGNNLSAKTGDNFPSPLPSANVTNPWMWLWICGRSCPPPPRIGLTESSSLASQLFYGSKPFLHQASSVHPNIRMYQKNISRFCVETSGRDEKFWWGRGSYFCSHFVTEMLSFGPEWTPPADALLVSREIYGQFGPDVRPTCPHSSL